MREKILTDHIKERTNDLNQLEAEFGKEETEVKRTKEVMKSQIMKK